MTFEDNLSERLKAAPSEDAMHEQATELSVAASHQALDRLMARLRESAAFLAAHGVPTKPLEAESFK